MIQATVKVGFTVVRVAAQTFYHATWLVQATVHGDDFTAARETQSLDVLDGALEQFFVLKKMPRIGPEFGRTSDGQFTKRTVSRSVEGSLWKADNSQGDKAVRYCSSGKREATRMTSPRSEHIGKSARDAAELETKDVTDTNRWCRQHTSWCGSTRSAAQPRQCSCERLRHFKLYQRDVRVALGSSVPEDARRSLR